MHKITRQLVMPWYNLRKAEGLLKPFKSGMVHLLHLQKIINPRLLYLSRSVGCVLSDQFMVPVKEKVHEKQSINEQLSFVQL